MRALLVYFVLVALFSSCKEHVSVTQSGVVSIDSTQQISYYSSLVELIGNRGVDFSNRDSIAILILPLKFSCPSCRTKVVKGILHHDANWPEDHIVILTARGGRKSISSYFREEDAEIPNRKEILLDSIDQAGKLKLYKAEPTIYYIAEGKVIKKVAAIPATVKNDLREFFQNK